MKKGSLIAAALLFAGATSFGQIQFAPEIGGTMYKQTWKSGDDNMSSAINEKFLPGLRAGAVVDIPVGEHFSVRPGLFYNLNRTKFEIEVLGAKAELTQTTHNLELPIYFTYKAGGHETGGFFAGIGPYLSYALAGNLKGEGSFGPFSIEDDLKMEFGNDDGDHMKPLDVGGSVMLGYELPIGLYFKGHYNLGLMNQQPGGDADNTRKAMSFGLSIGYFMGR